MTQFTPDFEDDPEFFLVVTLGSLASWTFSRIWFGELAVGSTFLPSRVKIKRYQPEKI